MPPWVFESETALGDAEDAMRRLRMGEALQNPATRKALGPEKLKKAMLYSGEFGDEKQVDYLIAESFLNEFHSQTNR